VRVCLLVPREPPLAHGFPAINQRYRVITAPGKNAGGEEGRIRCFSNLKPSLPSLLPQTRLLRKWSDEPGDDSRVNED